MSGRLRAAAVCILAAAACGKASGNGVRQVHGIVGVEPADVDFGDVALGKEGRTKVTLRNDGLVQAAIDATPSSLAQEGFVVEGLPVVLGPGESRELNVSFKPPVLGDHASKLDLVTDVPDEKPFIGLKGHAVRGLAQLSGDALDFGDVVLNELSTQDVVITNNDGHAVTTVQVARPSGTDAAAFTVAPETGSIDLNAEQSMQFRFEFRPDHLGAFTAVVPIVPCPTCSPRNVTLTGNGVERLVDVQPPSIDFGDVHLGVEVSQAFSVRNTSRGPLTLQSLTIPGASFITVQLDGGAKAPVTLAAGQTVTGTVRFKPMQLGAQAGQVTMAASDGAPGLIAVKGLGMGAVVKTSATSIFVGATATGTTRSSALTVTNVGLDPHSIAPLTLNGISVVSNDSSWRLDSASTVNVGEPGAATDIQVSFSPTVAGWSTANLVIASNDDLHPTITIPLKALGRDLPPCVLAVEPSSTVDFGSQPLFAPTTQGFELVNNTGADCIVGDPKIVSGGPAFHWPGGVAPSGRTLPDGGRMSVRVELVAETAQTYNGAVQFYVSNKSAMTQTVSLTGAGEDACFYVTPGAVDFGGGTQGCGALTATAYAVNHCAGDVTVTDVHTSGNPFYLGPMPQGLPFTVKAQTSAAINLVYQPQTPGDDVGSLSVTASSRAAPYVVGLTAGAQSSPTVEDQWDQSTPKVDMLIVIDNSGSMAEEQQALANNLGTLWNRIALANADFHIAVTSTGMYPYTSGWTQCPGGAAGGEAGRFFPVDASRPRLLTPQTPNVRDALFANTNVGQCHWDERFLDPVIAALTPPLITSTKAPGTPWPSDGNAGFLRDDARLALLAVSDADDDNDVSNPPPVSQYVEQLRTIKHGALDLVSFSGIVALHACSTVEQVGNRYMEIAKQLNGHLEDICDLGNMGKLLDQSLDNLLMPLTSFPLSQVPKDPTAIQVTVNGAVVTTWTYDAISNRIVFPQGSVPPPGSHITASYQPACS